MNNSLFGDGFGGMNAAGGSLFNNIQQTTFGAQMQQPTFGGGGGLFGSSNIQSQFNNNYAFGAQNIFNVQNQMQENYNNFNNNQADFSGGLYQQNYVNDYSNPFCSYNDQFQIRKTIQSQFQPLEQA